MTEARIERTDVLVVGAGVVGTSAAYFLAEDGVEVVLIDRDTVGAQASSRNAGGMHLQLGARDARIARSAKAMDAYLRSHVAGVALWEDLSGRLDADIEFRRTGGLMVADTDEELWFLAAKIARERANGLDVHLLEASDLRQVAPDLSEGLAGGEYCPAEGKINPLGAVASLGRGAARAGARVLPRTELRALSREKNGGFLADTSRGPLRCQRVVNAAGPWSGAVAAMLGIDLPVKYAVLQLHVTERVPPLVPHMVQHVAAPLTIKQTGTGTLLIGGGWPASETPGGDRASYSGRTIHGNLTLAARTVPDLGRARLARAWACVNPDMDGTPIIGPVPGAGEFHMALGPPAGCTVGPFVGRRMADMLCGRGAAFDVASPMGVCE